MALHELQDDLDGIAHDAIFSHTGPFSVGTVDIARTVEIINGYTLTFEDGSYGVDIVGGNSNIGESVNFNSVSVRSNNAGGLVGVDALQDLAFIDRRVFIDVNDGVAGQIYPLGTGTNPTNTYVDGTAIALAREIGQRFLLNDTLVLGAAEDIPNSDWLGTSCLSATLTLAGSDTTDSLFTRMVVGGQANGYMKIVDGGISGLTGFVGQTLNTGLYGDLALAAAGDVTILNAFRASASIPTVDVNGSTGNVYISGYNGRMNLTNVSGGNSVDIMLDGGSITVDASCTSGSITVSGVGNITDNSVGATIDDVDLVRPRDLILSRKLLQNTAITDQSTNTVTYLDDDNATTLVTGSIHESAAGTGGYNGNGIEYKGRAT